MAMKFFPATDAQSAEVLFRGTADATGQSSIGSKTCVSLISAKHYTPETDLYS
jgi:hypothetical protein